MQDAISQKEAAQMAGVTNMTIWNWVKTHILERYEIAEHPVVSKTELLHLLEERKQHQKSWKRAWLQRKAQMAQEYPQGKEW